MLFEKYFTMQFLNNPVVKDTRLQSNINNSVSIFLFEKSAINKWVIKPNVTTSSAGIQLHDMAENSSHDFDEACDAVVCVDFLIVYEFVFCN